MASPLEGEPIRSIFLLSLLPSPWQASFLPTALFHAAEELVSTSHVTSLVTGLLVKFKLILWCERDFSSCPFWFSAEDKTNKYCFTIKIFSFNILLYKEASWSDKILHADDILEVVMIAKDARQKILSLQKQWAWSLGSDTDFTWLH